MSKYVAPLADMRFVMFDLLKVDALYARLPGGDAATRDIVDAVLDEAAQFAETVLAPLNASGDEEGCTLDKASASVTTPQGFKQAYAQYVDGGWPGLTAPERYGGQHLPESIGAPLKEMLDSANLSWGNFPLLSHGASEALKQHGEEWQREAFLKPIVEGRWTGTMCLTEPHCGSDLGLLRTRAEPNPDDASAFGTYKISGTKIFITAGEHDLTENIVHLVLARLPDAPAGVKGISLFIVPKVKVDKSGKMGDTQQRELRRDRAQDGHQGLGYLRDEFRRGRRLADRSAESRPDGDVHDDEYRAPCGRHPGPGVDRARLSELAGLRTRAPAGALAQRREVSRQARRSADRASGYPAHAAHAEGVRRGARALSATTPRRWSIASSARPTPMSASAPTSCCRS